MALKPTQSSNIHLPLEFPFVVVLIRSSPALPIEADPMLYLTLISLMYFGISLKVGIARSFAPSHCHIRSVTLLV